VTTSFAAPASGSTLTVTATLTDANGNVSATSSDSALIDTFAPAVTVTITEDANNDGIINTAELSGPANVSIGLPGGAAVGDIVTVSDGTTTNTITLVAADLLAGTVTTSFAAPASGSTLTVTATLTDANGNVSATSSDSALIDTFAPAVTVTITEDANNDGIINTAELSGPANVSIGLPGGAAVGDIVTVSDGTTTNTITLVAADLLAGTVTTSFAAPASGSTLTVTATLTDANGNVSATSSDSALIDTFAPAVTVTITEDANNDGIINTAELSGPANVSIGLPGGAAVGDIVTVSDGTTTNTITLVAADLLAGTVTTSFAAPASGSTLTVTATLTDANGNVSATSSDSALIDTFAPAVTVTITEDANNDGIINTAELSGPANVSIGLPGGAAVGDIVTVSDGTTTNTITLVAADLLAGTVTTSFAAPASGSTLTVTATLTDANGNVSATSSDSALIDTFAPAVTVTITEDANNDGIINTAELSGPANVSIGLPGGAAVGDIVTVSDGTTTNTITLVAADLLAGTVTTSFAAPASGSTLTVTATLTDANGNVSATSSDSALIDTFAPAVTVTITEDANNDGIINTAELSGPANVSIGLPGGAAVGDIVTVSDGTTTNTITLVAADLLAGTVTTSFAAPASGSTLTVTATLTDANGNVSATSSDSALIDTFAPAVTVTITEDANNDGIINTAELSGPANVSIGLPGGAAVGDIVTVSDGTTTTTITLVAADLLAGTVTTSFAAPASGSTLTVTATLTDANGNVSATSSDSALIDTFAPAVTVTITEDANNDGIINTAELSGPANVSIGLPGGAAVGDIVTVSDGTTTTTITLVAADLLAGTVTTSFAAPASGSTLTVTATLTDANGNVSATSSDSALIDTFAPAVTVTITEDANNDGIINTAELSGPANVSIGLPGGAAVGDIVTVSDGTTTNTITLVAADLLAGTVTTSFAAPASGSTLTVTATLTDANGNVSATSSDSALIDTFAPAVTVTITEDANNDGIINTAELSGPANVSIGLPGGAAVGDIVTVSDGTTTNTITLVAADLLAGTVTTSFAAPASGSTLTVTATLTDANGNVSATSSDSALIDTFAPAVTVTITEDANNDGIINTAELSGPANVSIGLPGGAAVGDIVTVSDGTTTNTITLVAADLLAGTVTTSFAAPASGSTLTVTATLTDANGNVSATSSDSALIDTFAPAVTVTITEDANNDGIINTAELSGPANVSIGLPGGAAVGDIVTVSDGTTTNTITLVAADLLAGTVTTSFAAPASGSTLTVTATLTDANGNVSATSSDSALIDTFAPAVTVTITEDANNDGIINTAELSGPANVSIGLPGGAAVGDIVTVSDGTTTTTITLVAADLLAGTVTTSFAAPASGSTLTVTATLTDANGNVSATSSDSALIDTFAPAVTVTITEDANNDGIINTAELSGPANVSIGLPGGAAVGDIVTVSDGTTTNTITLVAADLLAGTVTTSFAAPASGSTLTVTATLTDANGNVSATSSDSALIDTFAPAVTVTITEDANNDGIINTAELSGPANVSIGLPGGAAVGDIVTVSDGTTTNTITLVAADLLAGTVTTSFAAPASGSTLTVTATLTDANGNVSATSSDSALIDTFAPAVTVTITEDANNDGIINTAELSGPANVSIGLPGGAAVGDIVTVSDGTTTNTITLVAADLLAGTVTTSFAAPASGSTLTVTATLTDANGNVSATSSDSALIDTFAPAVTVTITEDANNDGIINTAELSGPANVSIGLPGGAAVGDIVTVSDGTTTNTITLVAADLLAGTVTTSFAAPASGSTLTVTATLTDANGNVSATSSDSALIDTFAPAVTVTITEDANNDGIINTAELSGPANVSIGLPGGAAVGDIVTVSDGTTTNTITLVAADLLAGTVTTSFAAPASGSTLTVTATLTDANGNVSATSSDSALIDTFAPAVTVTITEDANNDGIINTAELSGPANVSIGLPGGAAVGDIVTVSDGTTTNTITLVAADLLAGTVTTSFAAPASGSTLTVTATLTDANGNVSATSSDSALIDTFAPAVTVTITEDANNDGIINTAELSGPANVSIGLPGGAAVGDIVTVSDGTTTNTITLVAADLLAGTVTTSFAAPASGSTLTVTATLTDANGNVSATSSDSALIDTFAPAVTVTITEDANNDGIINTAELSGPANVSIGLPGGAAVGDIVTVSDGTTTNTITLVAADLLAGTVTTSFAAPASGSTLTVTATLTDANGNVSATSSDSALIDTFAPAVTVTITEDANNDGIINTAELSGPANVSIGLPGGAAVGDIVTVSDGTTTNTITLVAADLLAGTVTTSFAAPASGSTLTVTATLTDANGNVSATSSDSALIDTFAPAVTVTITEDANNDGIINTAELSGPANVSIGLPGGAAVGDIVTVSDGTTTNTITLVAADLLAGTVTTSFAAPASGSTLTVTATLTDANGNVSATSSDSALIDTFAPAVTVTITEDANNDGIINTAELSGPANVSIGLPGGAAVGDIVTVSDGTTTNTITLVAADLLAGTVTTSFAAPASGSTLTVTATLTDANGNVSATSSDSALIDTFAPAVTVTITEDANNDGIINTAELSGPANVSIGLPGGAAVGDIVTVSDGTTTNTITLVAADLLAGTVTTSFAAPASGSTLTVTATLTDANGNVSATSSDSALIDTFAPAVTVTITEDANNDGIINTAELSGPANVSIGLPGGAAVGDIVTVSDGTTTNTITLVAADLLAGTVTTSFAAPASGSTLTVTATLTDANGNVSATSSDSALIDTFAPAVTVTITEDANNDGIINTAELSGPANVSIGLPGGAAVGDIVTVSDGTTTTTITLVAADLLAGTVTTSFAAPASGSTLTVTATLTDANGNVSATSSDSALIDTFAPAVTVTITEDANNDGIINTAELSGPANVSIGLPGGAAVGDIVTVSDGTTTNTITLVAADLLAGTVTTSFAAPASGSTLTVTATLRRRQLRR
jgi:hypothetical protein